ncbi:MAG: YciI family protein [Candidatus Lustribacter sp.]
MSAREQCWIIATTEDEARLPEDVRARKELADRHHAFIDQLDARGLLVAHGSARDEQGVRVGPGYIVIRAATRAEAESVALREPYIASGVRRLQLIPWQVQLGRSLRPFVEAES